MDEANSIDFEGLTLSDVAWIYDHCHPVMRASLNVDAIYPHLCQKHLLTEQVEQTLNLKTSTNSDKIDEIKQNLKQKGASGLQAFLVALNETRDGTNHNDVARSLTNAAMKRKQLLDSLSKKSGRRSDFPSTSEYRSEPSDFESFSASEFTPIDVTESMPLSQGKLPVQRAQTNPEPTSEPINYVTTPVMAQRQKGMSTMSRYKRYSSHSDHVGTPSHLPRKVVHSVSETALSSQSYGGSLSTLSSKGQISMQFNFGISSGLPIQESDSYSAEAFDEPLSKPVLVVGDQRRPYHSTHLSTNSLSDDACIQSRQDSSTSLVPSSKPANHDTHKLDPLVEENTSQSSSFGEETATLKQQPQGTSPTQQSLEPTPTRSRVGHQSDNQHRCTEECLSSNASVDEKRIKHANSASIEIETTVDPQPELLVDKPTQKNRKSTCSSTMVWEAHNTFYVSREKYCRAICKPDLNFYFRNKTIIPIDRTKPFFFFGPKEVGPSLCLDLYPCGLGADNEDQFSTLRVSLDFKSGGDKSKALVDTCWCDLKVKVTTRDQPKGVKLNTACSQKHLEQSTYTVQLDVNRMVSHNSVTHEASCDNLQVNVSAKLICTEYAVRESPLSEEDYTSVGIERHSIDQEEIESIPEEPINFRDPPQTGPPQTNVLIHSRGQHGKTISVPVEVEDPGATSQFPGLAGSYSSPIQSPTMPSSNTFRSPVAKLPSTRPSRLPPFKVPPLQETVVVAENAGTGDVKQDTLVLPQLPQPTQQLSLERRQESSYSSQKSGDEFFIPYSNTTTTCTGSIAETESHQASAPPLSIVRPETLALPLERLENESGTAKLSIHQEATGRELATVSSVLQKHVHAPKLLHHNFEDFLMLWSPQLPVVSKYYQCAESIAHVPFLGPVTVFTCSYHGGQFHSDVHDITVIIPKGAIPEGLVVNFELAVSLYGPFKFDDNTRPISPILWLCPQEDFEFQNPIKIILPHSLCDFFEEDKKSCTIQKATEYDLTQTDNLYNFSDTDFDLRVKQPHFFSKEKKQFVEFETLHCCHYCLVRKEWSQQQVLAHGYHLHIIKSKQEVIYSVTYYLGSCKQALMEQYPKKQGYMCVLQENKLIRPEKLTDGSSEYFKIRLDSKFHNLGVKMSPADGVINLSDVDYWGKDYKLLEYHHRNHQYPPRVQLRFKEFPLPVSLMGCTRDEELTTDIIPYVDLSKDQEWLNPVTSTEWIQPGRLTELEHLKIYHYLQTIDENDIILLGQALGLFRHNLKKMKNVTADMIDAWLNQADVVLTTSGCPTWESLCVALTAIGQGGIAKQIRDKEISPEMAALFQTFSPEPPMQPNGNILLRNGIQTTSTINSKANHYISDVHAAKSLNTQSPVPPPGTTHEQSTNSNSHAFLSPDPGSSGNESDVSSPSSQNERHCVIN